MNRKIELPTKSEALQQIEKLKQITWSQFDGKNLKEYIEDNHQKITSISNLFSSLYLKPKHEIEIPFKFYRVRALDDLTNEFLRCEHSYPPIEHSKNLRANLKGFPVLYASDHPYTALLEYLNNWDDPTTYENKYFVISKWSITNQKRLMFSSFFPKEFKDINEFAVLNEFTNEQFRQMTKEEYSNDEIDGFRELNQYFARSFVNDDKYSISSYIAYKSIYGNSIGNTLLIYPSKHMQFSKTNFAFHPNFVDESMKIDKVFYVKMKNITNESEVGIQFKSEVQPTLLMNVDSALRRVDASKTPGNKQLIGSSIEEDFKLNI